MTPSSESRYLMPCRTFGLQRTHKRSSVSKASTSQAGTGSQLNAPFRSPLISGESQPTSETEKKSINVAKPSWSTPLLPKSRVKMGLSKPSGKLNSGSQNSLSKRLIQTGKIAKGLFHKPSIKNQNSTEHSDKLAVSQNQSLVKSVRAVSSPIIVSLNERKPDDCGEQCNDERFQLASELESPPKSADISLLNATPHISKADQMEKSSPRSDSTLNTSLDVPSKLENPSNPSSPESFHGWDLANDSDSLDHDIKRDVFIKCILSNPQVDQLTKTVPSQNVRSDARCRQLVLSDSDDNDFTCSLKRVNYRESVIATADDPLVSHHSVETQSAKDVLSDSGSDEDIETVTKPMSESDDVCSQSSTGERIKRGFASEGEERDDNASVVVNKSNLLKSNPEVVPGNDHNFIQKMSNTADPAPEKVKELNLDDNVGNYPVTRNDLSDLKVLRNQISRKRLMSNSEEDRDDFIPVARTFVKSIRTRRPPAAYSRHKLCTSDWDEDPPKRTLSSKSVDGAADSRKSLRGIIHLSDSDDDFVVKKPLEKVHNDCTKRNIRLDEEYRLTKPVPVVELCRLPDSIFGTVDSSSQSSEHNSQTSCIGDRVRVVPSPSCVASHEGIAGTSTLQEECTTRGEEKLHEEQRGLSYSEILPDLPGAQLSNPPDSKISIQDINPDVGGRLICPDLDCPNETEDYQRMKDEMQKWLRGGQQVISQIIEQVRLQTDKEMSVMEVLEEQGIDPHLVGYDPEVKEFVSFDGFLLKNNLT